MERLDFADDLPDETDETRFKRHNRFLRSLREDTLLIVDNFNITAAQNPFLDVMLKCRCRILFTTRSRYENHISLEVDELNPDTLLKPKVLLTKRQKEKAALEADDKIGTTKDGRNRKATCYAHIHSLFSLNKLSGIWTGIAMKPVYTPSKNKPA